MWRGHGDETIIYTYIYIIYIHNVYNQQTHVDGVVRSFFVVQVFSGLPGVAFSLGGAYDLESNMSFGSGLNQEVLKARW